MNRRGRFTAGAALLLFVTALFSCTKVNNSLGETLVPDDQRMKMGIDTIYGINTYLAQTDSFPSERLNHLYMGSAEDKIFGRTEASASTQYMLSYYSSSYEAGDIFGTLPTLDSLIFTFTLDASYLGDTTKTQKFNVYELDKALSDTVYYANFDQSTVASDRLVFSFELKGVPTTEQRFNLTGEGVEEFARKLMDTTGGAYKNDTLFYKRFKGFYFVPDGSSPKAACVYRMSVSGMKMSLYTHNYTDLMASKRKDTVTVHYSFANGTSVFNNNSVNTIKHDYTGTPIQNLNDTLPGSPVAQLGYIQTLGGVSTYVRFTDEFVDELVGKIQEPYKSMVINRADLVWGIEDPVPDVLNRAPSRLGSYSKYNVTFPGIPDYNYTYESNSSSTLQYDGSLNRTHGDYRTEISSFLQKLVNHAKRDPSVKAPRTMMLGPGVGDMYDFKQVVLKTGESDPPLRVIVTYTLVR